MSDTNFTPQTVQTQTAVPVPVSKPSLSLNISDGQTFKKSDGVMLFMVDLKVTSEAGLRNIALSAGFSGGAMFCPPGFHAMEMRNYFYIGFMPVGTYAFQAHATDANGVSSSLSGVLHVVA